MKVKFLLWSFRGSFYFGHLFYKTLEDVQKHRLVSWGDVVIALPDILNPKKL